MPGKKSGQFNNEGIEGLAKDKPVVYQIEDDARTIISENEEVFTVTKEITTKELKASQRTSRSCTKSRTTRGTFSMSVSLREVELKRA